MILLRLLNPKLQFVPFGKGKIHARWNGYGLYPLRGRSTLCGRTITDKVQPMSEREMDVQKLCGTCYNSLRMYGPQVELVSVEVKA